MKSLSALRPATWGVADFWKGKTSAQSSIWGLCLVVKSDEIRNQEDVTIRACYVTSPGWRSTATTWNFWKLIRVGWSFSALRPATCATSGVADFWKGTSTSYAHVPWVQYSWAYFLCWIHNNFAMRDAQIINSLNYLVPSHVYVGLWSVWSPSLDLT